jgi:hypothetical protein
MGTTIPGNTIGSETNSTSTDIASGIHPPKLSLMRSASAAASLFPGANE